MPQRHRVHVAARLVRGAREGDPAPVWREGQHPTLNSSGNYEISEGTGVGKWRVKTAFPAQNGFIGSESAYAEFTIEPTGYTTETFLSESHSNGTPGHVTVSGHVNVTSAEGGPINGLGVNIDFWKQTSGGAWEFKFYDRPTIYSGYYEKANQEVGVGHWRIKAVFYPQEHYLESETVLHYFTIEK